MTSEYFTHLREIRSAEDRLRLLREARSAFRAAMLTYISQINREIVRAESELADAHTARVGANDPCLNPQPLPLRLLKS